MEKRIVLKNTGKDSLLIADVVTSCGCTAAMVSSKALAPGDTGALVITFNSTNFVGRIDKHVTINSNDPASPHLSIDFTANVVEEVVISPRQFMFGPLKQGNTAEASITVENAGKTPLTITGYNTTTKGFVLHLPSTPITPGTTVVLKAELTASEFTPLISGHLMLLTSSPRQAEIYIPILGSMVQAGSARDTTFGQ